jgi:hypothetical protein
MLCATNKPFMLSVITLNVVTLSVVGPKKFKALTLVEDSLNKIFI